MKKIISVIIAAFMSLVLFAGCTADSNKEEENLLIYESPNGYTVSYPQSYNASSLSHDIDFVIMDERTGSTVTVQAIEDEKYMRASSEREFIEQCREQNMNVDLISFGHKEINGADVLAVEYEYKESKITSMEYEANDNIYHATYTELPGTSEKIRSEMLAVINSITCN